MKKVSPHAISGAPFSADATSTSTPANVVAMSCVIDAWSTVLTNSAPGCRLSHPARKAYSCDTCGGATFVPDALSVQSSLPISGHGARRSWHRLLERVVSGRDQLGAVEILLGGVVKEPVFVRLVALHDRVPRVGRMVTGVLRWGRVTASDVSTTRAAAQMEPPTIAGDAFDTSRTAGRCCWINVHFVLHQLPGDKVIDVSIMRDQALRQSRWSPLPRQPGDGCARQLRPVGIACARCCCRTLRYTV